MGSNIKLNYLYRDGSNCKKEGAVIFANPAMIAPAAVAYRLEKACDKGMHFIAGQVGIPEVFLFGGDETLFIEGVDHYYHELCGIEVTDEEPTDERPITRFLKEFAAVSQAGWQCRQQAV